jgi:deoxyhypusine synthase
VKAEGLTALGFRRPYHSGMSEPTPLPLLQRISQRRINPPALTPNVPLADVIDQVFLSYNGGRMREGCQLFVRKMLADNATVGLALSGALTPAGLGMSCLVPLIEAGFIDWIVSTGANLYHDTHFALGMELHQSRPGLDVKTGTPARYAAASRHLPFRPVSSSRAARYLPAR